jgi:4'-phosphopantetheinyl transferase
MEAENGLPTFDADEVHIWCRNTAQLPAEAVEDAGRYLSPEELARRDRFHFPNDRRDFAVAHDLLRRALSCNRSTLPADWVFTADRYGKPSIRYPEFYRSCISFSLSHTRGAVTCAVAPGDPVGVDIERADRAACEEQIADRYFSPAEAAWLRNRPQEERHIRFTELWTLKEAFLKAIGIGLSGSLAAPSFRLRDSGEILFEAPPGFDVAIWHFALFEWTAEIRIAIAVAGLGRPRFTIRMEDATVSARLLAVST